MQQLLPMHQFPFSNQLSKEFSTTLHLNSEVLNLKKGEIITRQFNVGDLFYFLLEGSIQFYIQVEHENEGLKVGKSNKAFSPIGWSGFKEPYRYATTVKCTEDCQLICWKHEFLRELLLNNPIDGRHFLAFVVEQSLNLLIEMKELLANNIVLGKKSFLDIPNFETIDKNEKKNKMQILKTSPFFEIYRENDLKFFESIGKIKTYVRGNKIFEQKESSNFFDVLIEGKVAHIYTDKLSKDNLDLRMIGNAGYVIGNGCFTSNKENEVTCVALKNTSILRIDYQKLMQFFNEKPDKAIIFYLRMLWFISNRLRSARAKFLSFKHDGEIKAVKNIIEQNCTQLSVISELHKIPPLLSNTLTLNYALDTLERIKIEGNSLERSLATNSLEILSETVKENNFFNGLSTLYHNVVSAPNEWSHKKIRAYSAEQFNQVFEQVDYKISGLENLPQEPAIYIYNHLENHTFNTLPNNFQLTLDSHFISSMILYKHYNNPGIRVVRVPKGNEFGHQSYYGRLGHIPVYTKDSECDNTSIQEKEAIKKAFYQLASNYLKEGTSIILAPEGQSFTTNESPGLFKAGAFVLASKMENEPLIIPIAIANFDKRVNHNTFSVVIKKPFKISQKVNNCNDRSEMKTFLINYQEEYQKYVQEAIHL